MLFTFLRSLYFQHSLVTFQPLFFLYIQQFCPLFPHQPVLIILVHYSSTCLALTSHRITFHTLFFIHITFYSLSSLYLRLSSLNIQPILNYTSLITSISKHNHSLPLFIHTPNDQLIYLAFQLIPHHSQLAPLRPFTNLPTSPSFPYTSSRPTRNIRLTWTLRPQHRGVIIQYSINVLHATRHDRNRPEFNPRHGTARRGSPTPLPCPASLPFSGLMASPSYLRLAGGASKQFTRRPFLSPAAPPIFIPEWSPETQSKKRRYWRFFISLLLSCFPRTVRVSRRSVITKGKGCSGVWD